MKNSLSKTTFKVTADRLQHFTNDVYVCDACDLEYHPKVHSQPYVVQFGAILVGVGLFVVFKAKVSPWFYLIVPSVLGFAITAYAGRDRKVVTRDGTTRIRYGDIVLKCPECGSSKASRVT